MLLSILVALGIVVMVSAVLSTQKLIKSRFTHNFEKEWITLRNFMLLFAVGYIVILAMVIQGDVVFVEHLVGIIMFFGALFVYKTVTTGRKTISDLHYTTVSKQYVDRIINSMADTLIVLKIGPDLNITKVNQAFLNLLKFKEDEIVGQPLESILRSSDKVNYFIKECKTGTWLTNEEAFYYDQKGNKIPVLLSISCIRDSKNQIEEMIIAGKDITDRIKAQKALSASERKYKKLSEQLNDSNIMKELLLDVITHDLKNPAAVIKGFSEVGMENNPNDEILTEINSGVDNLLEIIDSANVMSKIATGEKVELKETNVSEMIDRICHEFASQLDINDMKLDNRITEDIILNVNPIIAEVFRNYISNAIKYAKSGKNIIVDAQIKKAKVIFNVIDFGGTIEKKYRSKIFARSKQLGNTAGEGLGLAIVDRIARAHNANVGVKPNTDKGNIFYVEIPT